MKAQGVELFVLPLEERLRPASLWSLGGLFRRTGTRIVQAHVREANTTATVAARLAGVPVVIGTVHSLNRIRGRRRLLQDRWLAAWRDTTIAVSESVKRNYCEGRRLPGARDGPLQRRRPPPVPTGAVSRWPSAALLEPLGADPRDTVVVCGPPVPPKAHGSPDAAARVLPQAPRTTFLLVGDGPRASWPRGPAPPGRSGRLCRRATTSRGFARPDVAAHVGRGDSRPRDRGVGGRAADRQTDVGSNAEAIDEGVSGFLRPVGTPDRRAAPSARPRRGARDRAAGAAAPGGAVQPRERSTRQRFYDWLPRARRRLR
jgi:hypothetical protein